MNYLFIQNYDMNNMGTLTYITLGNKPTLAALSRIIFPVGGLACRAYRKLQIEG